MKDYLQTQFKCIEELSFNLYMELIKQNKNDICENEYYPPVIWILQMYKTIISIFFLDVSNENDTLSLM